MKNQTIAQIQSKLAAKKVEVKELEDLIDARLKLTLVRCSTPGIIGRGKQGDIYSKDGCGRAYEIGELEYIQTYWEEASHGYTDACHHKDEGQWKCPNCSKVNSLRDNPDIEALKPLFKSVKDLFPK